MKDPETPGAQLQTGPVLAVVAIWAGKTVGRKSSSLLFYSIFLSIKIINKYFKMQYYKNNAIVGILKARRKEMN